MLDSEGEGGTQSSSDGYRRGLLDTEGVYWIPQGECWIQRGSAGYRGGVLDKRVSIRENLFVMQRDLNE